jgi:hypothetical protein
VETLACGHAATQAAPVKLCAHLLLAEPDLRYGYEHVLLMRGVGIEADLCCASCAAEGAPTPRLLAVCGGCVERVQDEGAAVGVRGTPGILERPQPIRADLERTDLPAELADPIDIQPVRAATGSVWIGLATSGRLYRLDLDASTSIRLGEVPAGLAEKFGAEHSLHLSPDGRFAAVVQTKAGKGVVVDLTAGRPTMWLDRGGYHVQHYSFAIAFLETDGQPVLVHATDWNRLDLSDPATGRLLTERGPTSYRRGEPRPIHYLDYFHAGLRPSPGGQWIADNGWVWHPSGVVVTWNAGLWRTTNVWESEDGPSRSILCWRAYLWDAPICWTDETTLAVWGIGDDDQAMIPGVRLFDVTLGAERFWFPGPQGALFFDGHLFSAAPSGLEMWDVTTGARLARISGFVPGRHHPGAHELMEIAGDHVVRWWVPPTA